MAPTTAGITRKVKACEACRKVKIRCTFDEGRETCVRCTKRGLPCKVNRSLQSILDDDATFRRDAKERISRLEETVRALVQRVGMVQGDEHDERPPRKRRRRRVSVTGSSSAISDEEEDGEEEEEEEGQEEEAGLSENGRSEEEGTTQGDPTSVLPLRARLQRETDAISQGLVPLEVAIDLVAFYLAHMDERVCGIVSRAYGRQSAGTGDLAKLVDRIRRSSSLLLLSLLSVAALHCRPPMYSLVYREFVRLASTQAFSREQTLDDVRSLVVGASFLPDVSWILVGTAVRISTERGFHEAYRREADSRGDTDDAYEEARLYYLIYVADHQCSIPYGRPPMTRQHAVVRRCDEWLDDRRRRVGDVGEDGSLIAQVNLWQILHDVIDLTDTDPHRALDWEYLKLRDRFSDVLQRWSGGAHASPLLYHFSVHFLDSAAFRAPPGERPTLFAQQGATAQEALLVHERRKVGLEAVRHAHAMLHALVEVPGDIETLASFVHARAAAAVVFLIKAHGLFGTSLEGCSSKQVLRTIKPVLKRLTDAQRRLHRDHVVYKVVSDLAKALEAAEQEANLAGRSTGMVVRLPLSSSRGVTEGAHGRTQVVLADETQVSEDWGGEQQQQQQPQQQQQQQPQRHDEPLLPPEHFASLLDNFDLVVPPRPPLSGLEQWPDIFDSPLNQPTSPTSLEALLQRFLSS